MSEILEFSDKRVKYKSLSLLAIGLCPTLAITTSTKNSLIIGLVIFLIIFISNLLTNSVESLIPKEIRGIVNIILIMSIVTVVLILLEVYFLDFYREFGIYIPLIGINSIFMRNNLMRKKAPSAMSSLKYEMFVGLGLTVLLVIIGCVRELLGNGSILGINLFGNKFMPVLLTLSPAGALITTGFILAVINVFINKKKANMIEVIK